MDDRTAFINRLVEEEMQSSAYLNDNLELQRYFEGRDKVVPYVPAPAPPVQNDTGEFSPNQVRMFKGFGLVGTMVTFWVSFLQVAASGALNTIFQYGAAAGFVMILLSSLKGTASGVTETWSETGSSGGAGSSGYGGGGRHSGSAGGTGNSSTGGNQYNQQNNYHNCNF